MQRTELEVIHQRQGQSEYLQDKARGVYFRGKRQSESLQDRARGGYIP